MLQVVFWAAVALILYTHAGYPVVLWLLARVRRTEAAGATTPGDPPPVSVIVAAHDEQAVIADKVANTLALDYPRDRLELVVASDGSRDRTAELARAAGADVVLDLPRQGKVRTQDAGVDAAGADTLVFSDANTRLAPDALRRLVAALGEERVGYVCGHVDFVGSGGGNQEGAYWRYEMAIRSLESRLGGVTAGNGGLYATRRESYVRVDPRMGHDLSFPFNMVKRGWRAVYEPRARGVEKMTPDSAEEYRRKRRMMSRTWLILLRGGILSPRGYGPLYALEVFSHRLLRYLTPFLHLIALGVNVALLGHGWVYAVTLALQLALLAAAALAVVVPGRALQLARYYVLVTAAPAAGLWDSLRHPVSAGWEKAEGTR